MILAHTCQETPASPTRRHTPIGKHSFFSLALDAIFVFKWQKKTPIFQYTNFIFLFLVSCNKLIFPTTLELILPASQMNLVLLNWSKAAAQTTAHSICTVTPLREAKMLYPHALQTNQNILFPFCCLVINCKF